MRTNHNRQARREGICFGAPRRHRHNIAVPPRRLAITADGDHIVRVAERIAAELEVSPELVEHLLPGRTAALTVH